jgi:hypothetical protein
MMHQSGTRARLRYAHEAADAVKGAAEKKAGCDAVFQDRHFLVCCLVVVRFALLWKNTHQKRFDKTYKPSVASRGCRVAFRQWGMEPDDLDELLWLARVRAPPGHVNSFFTEPLDSGGVQERQESPWSFVSDESWAASGSCSGSPVPDLLACSTGADPMGFGLPSEQVVGSPLPASGRRVV